MSPQQTIAHYRITAKLGEGGMGEVWRATDTKLGRDVALKILPEAFARDADRMARFAREAQVLASLNHPNIAAIYGVEERALVLELVEGPTLAERHGPGTRRNTGRGRHRPSRMAMELAATQPRDPTLILRATFDDQTPSVTRALRYLAAKQSGDLALIGLTGLIRQGDVPALPTVEQTAATIDLGSYGGQSLVSAIRSGFLNPDPEGVASLGRMATSASVPTKLQLAAANALGLIHSAAAVPYLGLLLRDSSPQMQLCGARGIAFFANGVRIPTPESMPSLSHLNNRQPSAYYTAGYRPDEVNAFVSYWQAWWRQHPEFHTARQEVERP